jgi:structure-specific recognition protein 1
LAETVEKTVRKKSKIDENMGELVARIENLSLVVPRGKYTADLHMNNMKLHGSTFNYKILYQNVVKAFLLPNNDGIHYSLVLGFSKPLRQGNTKYPYIIFQFKIKKNIQVELNLPAETLSGIHKNLKPAYSGPAYEIVAKLFKMIIGVNIIIPGSFKTSQGQSSIKCRVGSQEGYLFMMNKSMIFIKKPVIYIRLGEVARVEFQRVSGHVHMRAFDFEVILKSGMSTIFSGADKRELEIVTAYFKGANIEVKTINEMNNLDAQLGLSDGDGASIVTEDGGDGEEEEDDDFVAPDEEKGADDDWGSDDDGVDED